MCSQLPPILTVGALFSSMVIIIIREVFQCWPLRNKSQLYLLWRPKVLLWVWHKRECIIYGAYNLQTFPEVSTKVC